MRIIFEFAGGPLDGKAVVGRLGEQDEADRYYALTHHGKIGQRFRIASDYAVEILAREQLKVDQPHHFQLHVYRVTDRLEGENEVLIRAEYVDKTSEEPGPDVDHSAEVETDPDSRSRQRIREILEDASRSWTMAYSHCWPRETGDDGGLQRHLTLHLAHAMLNRNFSVFLDARQPGYPHQPVQVLGIAPGQDWFLAVRGAALDASHAAAELQRRVEQLASFWLGPYLAPSECQGYIDRVARHCQRGYGLVAATHWTGSEQCADSLVSRWGTERELAYPPGLEVVETEWPEPIVLGQLAERGTCHWLTTCFRIPRPEAESGG